MRCSVMNFLLIYAEMSDHNLDLSLRISAPPSNDTGSCCFRYKDCELPKKETTVVLFFRHIVKALCYDIS